MPPDSYNIRVCLACGLRYPLIEGHAFGVRCPHCLGETKVVLKKMMSSGPSFRAPKKQENEPALAVLVDNIRSAWNVGSILRSADGFGFAHAYLCGITPTPENEAVKKTSLGAEEFVKWSYHKNAVKLIKDLRNEGWRVLALEEDARAIKISRAAGVTRNTVLIIGNEVTGVDPGLLTLADEVLYIPMRGEKRSFNVANAFSIAAFSLVEQKR